MRLTDLVPMETGTDCGPIAIRNYYSLHLRARVSADIVAGDFPNTDTRWDDLWDHPYNHWKTFDTLLLDTLEPVADMVLVINRKNWTVWHWVVKIREGHLYHNGVRVVTAEALIERWKPVYSYNHKTRPLRWVWTLWAAFANSILYLRRRTL